MTTQQLEAQTEQAAAAANALFKRLKQQAEAEHRPMTSAEMKSVEDALDEAKSLKARLGRVKDDAAMMSAINQLTDGMVGPSTVYGGGIGAQFIRSDTWEWLKKNRHMLPSGAWTSPSSELMAATLSEDSASGGDLVVTDYRPGILPLPTRPLVMADLLAAGTTDSNTVGYMVETTFTNAADTVAEGATKPESTLAFNATTDPVRKIASWLPITEEMLEDVPSLRSYVDVRLRLGVQLAEDDQILNGSGVAPDVVGFLARSGLAAAVARGSDTNADAILKQINAIFNATGLQPTGVVMNPTNFQTAQLLKTADGLYVSGNSPFSAPQAATLWGLPVALTSAMTAGTALVGAFKTAAQLFRRGGLRVEASNSHANFFIENKVAIRAEERIALAVYRPSAFGTVTGLN
jgi:HK97 family phage major capsid protein